MVDSEGIKLKIFTLESLKMHLRAQKQLKMSFKNVSPMTDIFEKSHDVVLKLHENRNQTYFSWSFLVVPV